MDLRKGFGFKNLIGVSASDLQPVSDVFDALGFHHAVQALSEARPLSELSQAWRIEKVIQGWLSRQDDRDNPLVAGVDAREQAQFLER